MYQFVSYSDAEFDELGRSLEDNRCHVYPECTLPDCCSRRSARMGFEKDCNGFYILYIDMNIHADTQQQDFLMLLENGELRFLNFSDMVDFLRSLAPLFQTASSTKDEPALSARSATEHWSPTYDPALVAAMKESLDAPKVVWPEDIAEPLKKKIFGQDSALEEIATKIVINRLGRTKRLLTIAMIGPTATGKSDTARCLAEILSDVYGRPYGFIEISGNEFIGEHSVHRFFGAPPGYVGYGNHTLLEPVRKNPRHVIVINEIEKAHDKLLTGLMEAIDTGVLQMADNSSPIDLNQCILFFTSNIPLDLSKCPDSQYERDELCAEAFTEYCGRPEITGKIGNFVVFSPLSDKAKMAIMEKFVKLELANYDIRLGRIDEQLMLDFLKEPTKYGARSIRNKLSICIGNYLLGKRQLDALKGKCVCLSGSIEDIRITVHEEEE